MENGTLVIQKSSADHEGHYLCKADNGVAHGSTLSKLADIKVNGSFNWFQSFSVEKGKTTHFNHYWIEIKSISKE